MISDEEKRINNLYAQIGKQYFELHFEAPEPALQSFVLEIRQAKGKIDAYSEQVKKLKGIVRCPNCDNDVPYGTLFCSACGTRMEMNAGCIPIVNSNVKRCVSCGMPINEGSAFCTHCGTKVEQTPVVAENSLQQAQPDVCPNCKSAIESDAAFCMNCGTKL